MSSWCLVMVERLFLAVPRGCLRLVIVVFLIILTYYFSVIVLCFVVRYFVSILVCNHLDGNRELVALFCLSSWCLVIVVWLFLTMLRVCLRFMICELINLCVLTTKSRVKSFVSKLYLRNPSLLPAASAAVRFQYMVLLFGSLHDFVCIV